MSLEGDLKLPPRGPAKWDWCNRIMTKIARARGVISPDQSITAMPVTGGLMLSGISSPYPYGANEYNDLPNGYDGLDVNGNPLVIDPDPFQLFPDGSVNEGELRINGGSPITVAAESFNLSSDQIIAIKIPLALTGAGMALTARHWDLLTWSTHIDLSATVELDMITPATLASAGYVLPGTTSAATIYIPVAMVNASGKRVQWWHGAAQASIYLYHDHFLIGQA